MRGAAGVVSVAVLASACGRVAYRARDSGVDASRPDAWSAAVDTAADSGRDAGLDARSASDLDAGDDAGTDARLDDGEDAGIDAGRDAGMDAGMDAGRDAGMDAGRDAGMDAGGVDAGRDTGVDAGRDAGVDAGRDVGVDAGRDAGMDAGRDTGVDAGRDAGVDAGRDAGGCTPPVGWPPARSGAAVAFDERRRELVLHGGVDSTGILDDTFTWTPGGGWQHRTPSTRGPRAFASTMAYHPTLDQVILIGGCLTSTCGTFSSRLDRVLAWDGATWSDRGAALGSNYASAIGFDRTAGVLTYRGGWDFSAGGTTSDWTVAAWTGTIGTPKYTAQPITYDPVRGQMMFFGGVRDSTVLGETRVRSAGGGEWILLTPPASPSARQGVGLATDLNRSRVVLFGGSAADGTLLDETWEWDGSTWNRQFPGIRPTPRASASLVYDSARRVTLLFGGSTGTETLSDLWQWDGSAWTAIGGCPM